MNIQAWDHAPPALSWEQKIAYLMYGFSQMPQVEAPLEHRFEPGVYVRTMKVPADSLIMSRKHIQGHQLSLLEGSAILITPDDKIPFQAPASIHTKPGFYGVAYSVTAIIVETRHPNPTEERDIALLESKWFEPPDALLEQGRLLQLEYAL